MYGFTSSIIRQVPFKHVCMRFYNAHHNYKAKVVIGTFIHVVLYKILNQKKKQDWCPVISNAKISVQSA